MGGPPWECPPERLGNGRVAYRCNYGHMHTNTTDAWSCDGPAPALEGYPEGNKNA